MKQMPKIASTKQTHDNGTLSLWGEQSAEEHADYLTRQLITYLGNKRSLLGPIGAAVEKVKLRLGGKSRIRILDAFAGSGVVSRFFKKHASLLVSNDFEDYAAVVARCFLQNRSTLNLKLLSEVVADLNATVERTRSVGFIERLYAPRDDAKITEHDRVFYSRQNAARLDAYRQLIDDTPLAFRDSLLGPLLSEASVHANTSGVFKGFHKNPTTGLGQFGGGGADALSRILGEIRLETPILSRFDCDVDVRQSDANALACIAPEVDLTYLDPPYNQHPYGSNYFMLNLLVNYREPQAVSRVSGIPEGWQRSDYNVRALALPRLRDLVETVKSKFLLLSFNDEGFITPGDLRDTLGRVGKVDVLEYRYNTFRGSRNLSGRSMHVVEQLFLVEKR